MTRRSSLLIVGALAVLSACSETNPVLPTAVATSAQLAANGNANNAKACQKNGWQNFVTADGSAFLSEEACVSYAAKGGTLYKKPTKAAQTLAFTSTSPSFTLKGSPTYTPSATATSGLATVISLDAASTGCSLTSGVVAFTAAGVCVINANQAGNENWESAAQKQQSITVYRCIDTEALLRYAAATGGANEFCAAGTKIVLTQGEVVVGTTLSLTGVSGGNAIIDANATGRVLTVSGSLTLRDVTVTGGKGGERGGGIFVSDGSLVLNGSAKVDGNVAQRGGGLLMFGGKLTLNDQSSVSNNSSTAIGAPEVVTGLGGGIFAFGSNITMNGSSTVRKNTSDGSRPEGAGIWMSDAILTMNGSSAITENVAASAVTEGVGVGGGVFLGITTMILNEAASISGNSAAEDGGGIYRIANDVGTIIGVTATNVVNNSPNNCGGFGTPGCVP